MPKYFIITFGCQMNKSDSERIASVLKKIGLKSSPTIKGVDLIVVNMCSVRQSAVDRVWGLIPKFQKLKLENPQLKTVLTGCILSQDKRKFREKFDLILSIKDLPRWPNYLQSQFKTLPLSPSCFDFNSKTELKSPSNFSVLIPIIIGCNNFCSYCVIPYTRGPEISRPWQEIVKEAKKAIRKGAKEIWLLGQNVNRYYSKSKLKAQKSKIINFAKLLKIINDIPGDFWIRFTSSHPKPGTKVSDRKNFSWDELIKTIADCKKVTEYINLPVQSGDDEILKRMNRPYTVAQYKNLIKKIRKAIPNVCLSTDVIVGFPGETEKQFENTVKLFKEIKFDMAYIAEYSPRPQTAAFKLEDSVPKKEKERRRKALTEILKKTALENNQKYIGKTTVVLVDSVKQSKSHSSSSNFVYLGKNRTYKTVKFQSQKELVGKFVKVKIIEALPWGLKGKLILSETNNKKFLA